MRYAQRDPLPSDRALLHPDCDRRPRVHTGSVDPGLRRTLGALHCPGARGLVLHRPLEAITAGEDLHPTLRTLRPS